MRRHFFALQEFMQTQTPHNIHRDGQEDSEGHRDDRYNQPKTIQRQSNSVIAVICLSLPWSHVLRPEHVNRARVTRAAWGAVCARVWEGQTQTLPWSHSGDQHHQPVCPSPSERRCRQIFHLLQESNHCTSFPFYCILNKGKEMIGICQVTLQDDSYWTLYSFSNNEKYQIPLVWSKSC